MKKFLFLMLLCGGLFSTVNAQTKDKTKVVEVKAKKAAKSRGTNPNVKQEFSFCDIKDVPVAKPAKSRAAACEINIDNYTGLYVYVYVDGVFRGVVTPWSDGDVSVGDGYTTVYCISAGETYEWSAEGNCSGELVSFKLSTENSN